MILLLLLGRCGSARLDDGPRAGPLFRYAIEFMRMWASVRVCVFSLIAASLFLEVCSKPFSFFRLLLRKVLLNYPSATDRHCELDDPTPRKQRSVCCGWRAVSVPGTRVFLCAQCGQRG